MRTLILSIFIFTLSYYSHAQNVNVPDAIFKDALISAGIDTNDDGEISFAECEGINYVNVNNQNIADLTGIEAFVHLDSLYCGWNQLINLDISKNSELSYLYCSNNQLTNLDVSKNSALTYLECYLNQLTSLDVSNNNALTDLLCHNNQITSLDISNHAALNLLNCSFNQLTSLDVSNDSALHTLDCHWNQLTSLDVSENIALVYLLCSDNQITRLDISNNSILKELWCSENQIENLDVSDNFDLNQLACGNNKLTIVDVYNNTALYNLDCSYNQLASLDVSNNKSLQILNLSYMPDLKKVCVWEMPFPPSDISVDTTGSPNVYFTTDCSTRIPEDNQEKKAIIIYPNPSDDIINIGLENSNCATIEIFNFSGTLVFSKAMHSASEKVDISGLSKGVYLVKVKQDSSVIVEKATVQ
jgi:hypothetical protein